MIVIERRVLFQVRRANVLYIRIIWNKIEVWVSTGFEIDKEKFKDGRCLPGTSHGKAKVNAATINRHISKLIDNINDTFAHFEAVNIIPSKAEFTSVLKGDEAVRNLTIEGAWLTYIREGVALKQWSDNTVKSIRQVANLFKKFRPTLTFKDITINLLNDFTVYQQTNRLSESTFNHDQPGYANNVIAKNCNVLKRFLKWCATKNLISSTTVGLWHPDIKSIRKPVLFLTWEELMRIYKLDLSTNKLLEEIRDMFCFMCFTGIRVSDTISLTIPQITTDAIKLTTFKTSDNLDVDINKFAQQVIDKYLALSKDKSGYLFPRHTCVTINHHLKRIAMMAKLDAPVTISQYYGSQRITHTCPKYEIISTHWGRRTFVCNSLSLGIPIHIVMKWTGHKDYEAMKPYINVADEIRKREMEKFNKL